MRSNRSRFDPNFTPALVLGLAAVLLGIAVTWLQYNRLWSMERYYVSRRLTQLLYGRERC
jgi:hypothetical protein